METNISYHDLKLMKCEDIKELLTKETVLGISQNYFDENPKNSADILALWLNNLSRSYFAATDLDLELEFLRKLSINLISGSFVDQQTKCFAEYRNYVNNAKEFLKWAHNLFCSKEDVLAEWMLFFIKNEIEFLDLYHKKENENIEELKELVSLTISLHDLILEIIDGSLSKLSNNYTSESDCKLSKTILELCRIGQRIHMLNFKCFSQNWKVITNLCVHYLKYGNLTAVPDWYDNTTGILLNGAGKYVYAVYQSESRKDSNDIIQRYMLFINFNLRMLNKIAEVNLNFIGESFIDLIYKLLINIYGMSKRLKNREIPKLLVKTGLVANLLKSLQLICQNRHYHKIILKNASNTQIDLILFELICDTLNAGIETDKMLLRDSCQFYAELFVLLFKDTFFFTKAEDYDKLVVKFTALTIKDETCWFKNFVRTQVIKKHLPYSHTSTDILLTALSVFPGTISRDDALKEYRFWLLVNNAYGMDSMEISQLQVQRMLRNCFQFCRSSHFKFTDAELMLNTEIDIPRDFRQLQCIGWKHVAAHKLVNRIEGALTNIDTAGISIKDFKEVVACLGLFEDKSNLLFQGGQIMVKLTNLCQKILLENDDNINYYIMFMNAFFALFLQSTNNTRIHVLSQLAKHSRVLLKFTSWYLLKFFHECSQVPSEWQNVAKQFINEVNISNSGPKMCKLLYDETAGEQSQICEQQSLPPGKRLRLTEQQETTSFKQVMVAIDAQINSLLPAKQTLDDQEIKLLRKVMVKLDNIATNSILNE